MVCQTTACKGRSKPLSYLCVADEKKKIFFLSPWSNRKERQNRKGAGSFFLCLSTALGDKQGIRKNWTWQRTKYRGPNETSVTARKQKVVESMAFSSSSLIPLLRVWLCAQNRDGAAGRWNLRYREGREDSTTFGDIKGSPRILIGPLVLFSERRQSLEQLRVQATIQIWQKFSGERKKRAHMELLLKQIRCALAPREGQHHSSGGTAGRAYECSVTMATWSFVTKPAKGRERSSAHTVRKETALWGSERDLGTDRSLFFF